MLGSTQTCNSMTPPLKLPYVQSQESRATAAAKSRQRASAVLVRLDVHLASSSEVYFQRATINTANARVQEQFLEH